MLAKELDLGPCGEETPMGVAWSSQGRGDSPSHRPGRGCHAGWAAGNNDFTASRRPTRKMALQREETQTADWP